MEFEQKSTNLLNTAMELNDILWSDLTEASLDKNMASDYIEISWPNDAFKGVQIRDVCCKMITDCYLILTSFLSPFVKTVGRSQCREWMAEGEDFDQHLKNRCHICSNGYATDPCSPHYYVWYWFDFWCMHISNYFQFFIFILIVIHIFSGLWYSATAVGGAELIWWRHDFPRRSSSQTRHIRSGKQHPQRNPRYHNNTIFELERAKNHWCFKPVCDPQSFYGD